MSLSLPALDTLTGVILIGTWASSLLYMLEIVQGVYYFRHFGHDDWKFKTLVTVALVVDGLSFIGDYICVYEYTITHAGDLEYLATIHWPLPLYGFTTGVLGVLVQTFLVFRYWRFTQKTVIALFLSLAMIISFGSVFTCSLMLTLYTDFKDRQKFKIPMACVLYHKLRSSGIHTLINAALWLVTEVAVDVGITLVLLWEFRKAKGILIETRSTLDRLTAVTVQSGAAAATLAIGGLLGYYLKTDSNLSLVFLYPLGRVYVITLLSNLNVRKSTKSFSTTGTYSGSGTSGGQREPLPLTSWTTDDSCGLHVHNTFPTSVQSWIQPRRSAYIDYWPEGIETTPNYSSKKHPTLAFHSGKTTATLPAAHQAELKLEIVVRRAPNKRPRFLSPNGLSPLSALLYLIFADEFLSNRTLGFIDDNTRTEVGYTVEETTEGLRHGTHMEEEALLRSLRPGHSFDLPKFQCVISSPQGASATTTAQSHSNHTDRTQSRGTKATLALSRISFLTFRLPHSYVRQLFLTVVVPRMEYALMVWYRPVFHERGREEDGHGLGDEDAGEGTTPGRQAHHRCATHDGDVAHMHDELFRPQCSVLTQIHTGHIGLNTHLHRLKITLSPNCALCSVPETVPHFLLLCPIYRRQRLKLILRLGTARLFLRRLLSPRDQVRA
ncbi:hypothetical protein DFH08DRAFT_1041707 [Mycena albidolilacea]|uniref:DUF6534 domain-containing protein n=1 Tax=Mycena albidolilacea TaxID=1033008 RepID=A0AAD7ED69_9AGAR|nr:hypothetical protein DFH08DRAFT_1041707 [Mycena albidolilacea]